MLGEMWWKRMANAVRFLQDALDALSMGTSVVLNFVDEIPWLDIFLDELAQNCSYMTDSKSFVHLDCKENNVLPGEYLLNRFCSEAERNRYWPPTDICQERFLAKNTNSTIQHRFVCVSGIAENAADKWISSGIRYLENFSSEEDEHGLFILITKKANIQNAKGFLCLQYSDYVTDYDCMMLCLTLLSTLPYSRLKKIYLAEIASNLADNQVEIAGQLISEHPDLAEDPIDIAKRFFYHHQIPVCDMEKTITNAVWEAQIRLVFPQLEKFRRNWIQKYEKALEKQLPITSSNGDRVDKVSDLEIGQLCRMGVNASETEKKLLLKMRNARNTLAHNGSLTYTQLLELKIF